MFTHHLRKPWFWAGLLLATGWLVFINSVNAAESLPQAGSVVVAVTSAGGGLPVRANPL
jgi:hypothetical protein